MPIDKGVAYAGFFGELTRSATHEIKNELAVINEQSRLISEMLEMADKGREPDPDRLYQLIGRVIERVGRADQAVRRLNAFAHSAEEPQPMCDAVKGLKLMSEMYARLAALRDVRLTEEAPESLSVGLSALDFERLVWCSLATAVKAAAKGSTLLLSLERGEAGAVMRLQGEFIEVPGQLPSELVEPLEVNIRQEQGALIVELPPAAAAGG